MKLEKSTFFRIQVNFGKHFLVSGSYFLFFDFLYCFSPTSFGDTCVLHKSLLKSFKRQAKTSTSFLVVLWILFRIRLTILCSIKVEKHHKLSVSPKLHPASLPMEVQLSMRGIIRVVLPFLLLVLGLR